LPELSLSQRVKASAIGATASPLIAALCATLRWKADGAEHWDAVIRDGRRPIMAFWHGRILSALHYWRNRDIVVITSQNFDGEWIAKILPRFGYRTARGSSSRGAVRALVQLRRDLAEGRPVAFTLDGPRGPARVAQAGAVWLAGNTGSPILPFHIEADRFWSTKSWDRTQIPKPFSSVAISVGPPLYVQGTDEEKVESARRELEAVLAVCERRAKEMLLADNSQHPTPNSQRDLSRTE
jgi:lysophospholipid acyltransferase (LPLAT)-like uncharacterized protein